MSDSDEHTHVQSPLKKNEAKGRMTDVLRQLRLQSHESGENCNCKRLKCFENVSESERKFLLAHFNSLQSVNEQNSYLTGLISVKLVKQRRPRKDENLAKLHDASFAYIVRVTRENQVREIPVCFKAFCSIHGITKGKLEYLQKSLKYNGVSPVDKRGKHTNRPKKLKGEVKLKIKTHLQSFKGRSSHYSMKKTSKIYLPEEFDIKKVYDLFKEQNPQVQISYDTYRREFKKYNIAFGYPRSDTCSKCDKYMAEVKSLQKQEQTQEVQKKLKELQAANTLHKLKAQTFYDRKRAAKNQSRQDPTYEAIAMDYQKNVSLPNISTNDVYYRRQLSMFSFNIHTLSNGKSYFYVYPETTAKKGSTEVMSFLYNYIMNYLDDKVKYLDIFCDSAGGQNKNYNMIKFIHFIVHKAKRLDKVTITFPIRGHSYMECDKNFGLVKLKTRMETPKDFYDLLSNARNKPEPFTVINLEEDPTMVRNWTHFLESLETYKKMCPFKIQEIRQLYTSINHPRYICHRATYNGCYVKSVVVVNKKNTVELPVLHEGEMYLPDAMYNDKLKISKAKYDDLKVLKTFCSAEAQILFDNLPHE